MSTFISLPLKIDLNRQMPWEIPVTLRLDNASSALAAIVDLKPCPHVSNGRIDESKPAIFVNQRGQVLPPDPGID